MLRIPYDIRLKEEEADEEEDVAEKERKPQSSPERTTKGRVTAGVSRRNAMILKDRRKKCSNLQRRFHFIDAILDDFHKWCCGNTKENKSCCCCCIRAFCNFTTGTKN
jgi:hypothetical protein